MADGDTLDYNEMLRQAISTLQNVGQPTVQMPQVQAPQGANMGPPTSLIGRLGEAFGGSAAGYVPMTTEQREAQARRNLMDFFGGMASRPFGGLGPAVAEGIGRAEQAAAQPLVQMEALSKIGAQQQQTALDRVKAATELLNTQINLRRLGLIANMPSSILGQGMPGGTGTPGAEPGDNVGEPGTYTGATAAHEGYAKNPNSTAFGYGQFLESTWLAFAKAHPELFPGMNQEQILAKRADANIAGQAINWLAGENAPVLQRAGITPNGQSLGIAHYVGASPAARIMQAPDGDPVSKYVSDAAVKANPELGTMSVGQMKQRYARMPTPGFLGGGAGYAPGIASTVPPGARPTQVAGPPMVSAGPQAATPAEGATAAPAPAAASGAAALPVPPTPPPGGATGAQTRLPAVYQVTPEGKPLPTSTLTQTTDPLTLVNMLAGRDTGAITPEQQAQIGAIQPRAGWPGGPAVGAAASPAAPAVSTPPAPAPAPATTAGPAQPAPQPQEPTPEHPFASVIQRGSPRVPDTPPPYVRPQLTPEQQRDFSPTLPPEIAQQYQEKYAAARANGDLAGMNDARTGLAQAQREWRQGAAERLAAFDKEQGTQQYNTWKTNHDAQIATDTAIATAQLDLAKNQGFRQLETDQKTVNDYRAAADAAVEMRDPLMQILPVLQSLPRGPIGAALAANPTLRTIAKLAGLNENQLAGMEGGSLYQQLINNLVTKMSPRAIAGSARDTEIQQRKLSLPELTDTPTGRQIGLTYALEQANRTIDEANFLEDYSETDPTSGIKTKHGYRRAMDAPAQVDRNGNRTGGGLGPPAAIPNFGPPKDPANLSADEINQNQRFRSSIAPGQKYYRWVQSPATRQWQLVPSYMPSQP